MVAPDQNVIRTNVLEMIAKPGSDIARQTKSDRNGLHISGRRIADDAAAHTTLFTSCRFYSQSKAILETSVGKVAINLVSQRYTHIENSTAGCAIGSSL